MKWKIWLAIIAAAFVIEIPLLIIDVNPYVAMAVTFVVIMSGYFSWWGIKSRRLNDILDEKCDPRQFIEKYEKLKSISKRIPFQNSCNVNIAVGLESLGHSEEALDFLLQNIDLRAKSSKMFKTLYHLAIFCGCLNVDNLDKAADEYNNHLKELRKTAIVHKIVFAIDASFAEYQYKLNKSPETARVFLEQLEYLYNIHSKKIGKRFRLIIFYNKADILHTLGDYKGAAENYKLVSERGNGLWIAEDSRIKLGELEALNE